MSSSNLLFTREILMNDTSESALEGLTLRGLYITLKAIREEFRLEPDLNKRLAMIAAVRQIEGVYDKMRESLYENQLCPNCLRKQPSTKWCCKGCLPALGFLTSEVFERRKVQA